MAMWHRYREYVLANTPPAALRFLDNTAVTDAERAAAPPGLLYPTGTQEKIVQVQG